MAGLLGVWWGKGDLGSKLHPPSCSRVESHFFGIPDRMRVLGSPMVVARVSSGESAPRVEKEGWSYPGTLGTQENCQRVRDSLTETEYIPLLEKVVLKKPLIHPS